MVPNSNSNSGCSIKSHKIYNQTADKEKTNTQTNINPTDNNQTDKQTSTQQSNRQTSTRTTNKQSTINQTDSQTDRQTDTIKTAGQMSEKMKGEIERLKISKNRHENGL